MNAVHERGSEVGISAATVFAALLAVGLPSDALAWGSQGNANGQFERPRGIAVDAGGRVYVADTGNHRIQVFDSSGQFLFKFGTRGGLPGQLESPCGITPGAQGTLYVADTGNHRVVRFDPGGGFLAAWGGLGSGRGQVGARYEA